MSSVPPDEGRGRRTAGRRALFSVPSEGTGSTEGSGTPIVPPAASGRRALFSDGLIAEAAQRPDEQPVPSGGHLGATVHCRTCLVSTRLSLAGLVRAVTPSVWLPGRQWSRLMRCPACHRVSWCRVEYGRQ